MENQVADPVRTNKLSNLVWEFNFRPDNYIHDSWLEQMPDGPLIRKLVGRHRSADRIVQHLLQRFGLENQVFFNFSNSLTRIALWSGDDLEKLVLYTGAVFYYSRIQKIVTREELHQVRDDLGEELFQFMQNRALRMRGKMDLDLKLPDKLSTHNALILAGMLCMQSALGGYSLALRKRLMLKLPHEWFVLYKRAAVLGRDLNQQQAGCAALIQKVAIEIRMGVGSDGQIHFS
ncbi:MAG: SctK family type III secretion system sorting platform protein [Thiolinea sp.]